MLAPRPPPVAASYPTPTHQQFTPRELTTFPDIRHRRWGGGSPRSPKVSMVGPTQQLRELIRLLHPVNVLRECMVVFMQHKEVYGPLMKVLMREYDRLVELHGSDGLIPDVTLFEDVAAANERYLVEKRTQAHVEGMTMEMEAMRQQLAAIRGAYDAKVRELQSMKDNLAALQLEYTDVRTQLESHVTLLKQTREEVKRQGEKNNKVIAVHSAGISMLEKRHAERLSEIQTKSLTTEKKLAEAKEQVREVTEEKDRCHGEIAILENRITVLDENLADQEDIVRQRGDTIAHLQSTIQELKDDMITLEHKIEGEGNIRKRQNEADAVNMVSYMNQREMERRRAAEPPRSFQGIGVEDTVPLYLRTAGKVDNINLTYPEVRTLVEEAIIARRADPRGRPMSTFFQEFLFQKCNSDTGKTFQTAYSVIDVLSSFEWDTHAECLTRILNDHCPEVLLNDMNDHVKFVSSALVPYNALADVRRALLDVYPMANAMFLASLYASLQKDVSMLGTCDTTELLDPSQCPTSYFLNEIRSLFFFDAVDFRSEVLSGFATSCEIRDGVMYLDQKKAVEVLVGLDSEYTADAAAALLAPIFPAGVSEVHYQSPEITAAISRMSILRKGSKPMRKRGKSLGRNTLAGLAEQKKAKKKKKLSTTVL